MDSVRSKFVHDFVYEYNYTLLTTEFSHLTFKAANLVAATPLIITTRAQFPPPRVSRHLEFNVNAPSFQLLYVSHILIVDFNCWTKLYV